MAGVSAFQSGDYKKSKEYHLYALDIIATTVKDEEKAYWMQCISYYNLSVTSSLQYQRCDAEGYIAKALEICMTHNVIQFKQRILMIYQEYFGEIQVYEEEENAKDPPQQFEFNFLPGAIEKVNNKIVELRCESPNDGNKRKKNSKRSLSRA